MLADSCKEEEEEEEKEEEEEEEEEREEEEEAGVLLRTYTLKCVSITLYYLQIQKTIFPCIDVNNA